MYEEDAEAVLLAEELGYTEAWCGEHYSSGAEPITSPLIFLASLISRTSRIKLCSGVVCLPNYHPAMVAGQLAMFDHLAKGRFIMGVGPGGLPSDFELFDVTNRNRGKMMEESLAQILHMWQVDPPYDIKGEHWSYRVTEWYDEVRELGYIQRPLQQPHPPIAITGMSPASGSLKYAGSHGYIPVSANFIGPWAVKTHWPKYVEGAVEAGRKADPSLWRVARSIYVAETDAEAERFVAEAGSPFDFYFKYLFGLFDKAGVKGGFVAKPGDDANALRYEDMRDNFVIAGSPRTVAEKIAQLREDVGSFGTLLYAAHDWSDKARMTASMELMAREVMPLINAGSSAGAASAEEVA
jgi:alkanesulfonate monooxygenase SsuD/methylene tetrahydromethanopterin reductase-like flavin-dependent oxidoreductase (luciferase family)